MTKYLLGAIFEPWVTATSKIRRRGAQISERRNGTIKERNGKGMNLCQCHKCHVIFRTKDVGKRKHKMYGMEVDDLCCPSCGGEFTIMDDPKSKERYLYINNDHRYFP